MPTPSESTPLHRSFSPKPARALCLAAVALLAVPVFSCGAADDDTVLVLAAASTIDALESAVLAFNGDDPTRIDVSFASTSVLARQIEEGAPADMMLSASVDWADYVEKSVTVARRVTLVRNRLVVVAPASAEASPRSLAQLADDDSIERIAIADPASVPAGIYSAEALRRAGLWESVAPRLIPTVDVRAALRLVAEGEADAGFVYSSDAATTTLVRVVTRIDTQLHEPIEYPLLLLGGARPGAARFYEYLISDRGRAHFYDRGFDVAGR